MNFHLSTLQEKMCLSQCSLTERSCCLIACMCSGYYSINSILNIIIELHHRPYHVRLFVNNYDPPIDSAKPSLSALGGIAINTNQTANNQQLLVFYFIVTATLHFQQHQEEPCSIDNYYNHYTIIKILSIINTGLLFSTDSDNL